MSTERDELAKLLKAERWKRYTFTDEDGLPDYGIFEQTNEEVADAILAAGYRRPRQVTTVEELDALPVESIVRDATGFTWGKWWDEDGSEFTWWATTGDRTEYSPKRVNLPATVLHVGGPK